MNAACPVARVWRGETSAASADAYQRHLTGSVFPQLERMAGHLGAHVLRRQLGEGVEFLVVTLWASEGAIRAFAGDDLERAVVEPAALALLSAHDDFVKHFHVAHRSHAHGEDGSDRAVPILPVQDVRAAVDHYAKLGFDTSLHDPEVAQPTYGFAVRQGVEIHFTRVPGVDPKASLSACYLHVADAPAVHAAWKLAAAGGRLGELEVKPWGKLEFAYTDPDGHLLRVGSPAPGAHG